MSTGSVRSRVAPARMAPNRVSRRLSGRTTTIALIGAAARRNRMTVPCRSGNAHCMTTITSGIHESTAARIG